MKMYSWAVWQHNRLAGYVMAMSAIQAQLKAHHKYGSNLYVERYLEEKLQLVDS